MRVPRWRNHLRWRPATSMAVAVAVIFSLARVHLRGPRTQAGRYVPQRQGHCAERQCG